MFLREENVTLVVHILMILVNMIYANGGLDAKSEELLNLHRKYRQDLVDCKVDGQPPAKYMSPLMAWAKTTDIGCGVANCPRYGLSIVCNYGPGGNWNNEKPYEVKPRNLCPKVQNIPKNSLQTNSVHTQHGPKPLTQSEEKVSTNIQNGRRECNQREQSRSRY
ncbi:unnamed protein product [Schistosoma rodhaini]|nr:unnamed protein product [Schistosoma rodhaini]